MSADGIRAYRPGDLERLREITIVTSFVDEETDHSLDPLLPDVYLEPYVRFAPDWVRVVDVGEGAEGYLIAVPDTDAFIAWWREHWTPLFRERHGDDASVPLRRNGLEPERMRNAATDAHPAHLHIDLHPRVQNRGLGARLIEELIERLREERVPGVNLGVHPGNVGAKRFYARLGFEPVDGDENQLALAIR